MESVNVIDVGFDFREDTPPGKDPDTWSPTLRRYHRLLWGKPLPDGTEFELDDTTPGVSLHHRSDDTVSGSSGGGTREERNRQRDAEGHHQVLG